MRASRRVCRGSGSNRAKKHGTDGKSAAGEAAFDAYAIHKDGSTVQHTAAGIE